MKNYWSRKQLEALGEPINPVSPSRLDGRVGGGGKSTPETPDYVGAAEATAKSNAEAMKVQTVANRPNLVTPFGTQSWTNNRTFDQAGYDDAMSKYNNQVSSAPSQRYVPPSSYSSSDQEFYRDGYYEDIPGQQSTAMAAPDREKFYSPDNWTQTTTLSPESQQALNSQMAIQKGRSDTALGLMPQVNAAITNPIDKSQFQNWGSTPTMSNFQNMGAAPNLTTSLNTSNVPGMPSASNYQNMGAAPSLNRSLDMSGVMGMPTSVSDFQNMGAAPNLNTSLDTSAVMGMPTGVSNFQNMGAAPTLATGLNKSGVSALPGDANAEFVQKYVDRANAFARPQNELDQSNMDAKLFNMGLTPGSNAYNNAQRSLADQRSRNEFNAINTGMNQSNQMYVNQLASNNQTFNQALQEGNFGNTARQNQNTMDLANSSFNNQNLANQFTQQMGLNNQGFNQALQSGNFANTAKQNQNTMNLANTGFNNQNLANQFTQQMGMNNQGFNQALASGNFANSAMKDQNALDMANAGFNNQNLSNNFTQQMGLNNQGYNQALSSSQFGNNALKDQNAMSMANANFNNNNAAVNFNQNLSASNYANTLRQAQYTMAQQEQLHPLNNLNALLNGQQVGMPNMPSFMGAGNAGGVNYSGAVNSQYQADLAAANAQNAGSAGLMSGLFSLGGQALGGPLGGMMGKAMGFGLGG